MGTFLPFGLNLIVVIVSVFVLIIGAGSLISAIGVRKKDRNVYLRNQAKEKSLPIIMVIDLNGTATSVLGIVDEKVNDIYFDDKKLSLRVRPSFLDVAEPIIVDGIKTYLYFGQWYYPTGAVGLTCMVNIVDLIRKQIPELAFIGDDLVLILTTTVYEGDALKYNVKMLLQDYEQEDYLIVNGSPVMETVFEEQPTYDDNGEELLDDDDEPIMTVVEVPIYDTEGNVIYKKNPKKVDEIRLLELIKKAKNIVFANNLRPGFIPIRTASALIPGKADGNRLDTLIKLREKKRDLQNANKDKIGMYLVYMAAIIGFVVIVGYFIYSIMGK